MYSVQTKKDETVLSDATRFNSGMVSMNAAGEHLGSYTYNAPLKQDVYTEAQRVPDILTAFNNNPYSQKLNSYLIMD
jgi:flagellar basal body P-ring protein FlgI